MQCVSKDYPTSFVITDPKGGLIGEVGQLLVRSGYRVKVLNTINFSKSMRYNPFRYIAFSEGSSSEGCDFPQSWSVPNHTGDATLPLRWLPPATLLWTCHLGTPCVASCSQPTSFIKYAIFSIANEV